MLALEQLGFTKEELQQRVVDQMVDRLLGGEIDADMVHGRLKHTIVEQINAATKQVCDTHSVPAIVSHIERLVIKRTNQYGEKTGDDCTFVEHLIGQCQAYLVQKVDKNGRSRGDSYFEGEKMTRVEFLLDQQIGNAIKTAMDQAIKTAHAEILSAVGEVTRQKLEEISSALKVSVVTAKR